MRPLQPPLAWLGLKLTERESSDVLLDVASAARHAPETTVRDAYREALLRARVHVPAW